MPSLPLTPITRRVHHVQRFAQVLEVLARHGFHDLSQQLGLHTLIGRSVAAISGQPPPPPAQKVPLPVRLRSVMEDLGPTFVKLGQVLSTRPDLVPQEWADTFKSLQNNVPGVEYPLIQKTLAAEFPGQLRKIFRSIQKKPLAAGSMAQVHRAALKNGTRVVLKILRPGIRELIAVDMDILQELAGFVEKHFADKGYSPTEVVAEFAKELTRETDLMYEGRSTERLGLFFADDPDIVFPTVYWQATTKNVLCLDEIPGLPLANTPYDSFTPQVRRALVENGTRAVFRQCLDLGFFHADPHPGNIIALPKGRIAFIDCGMTGQVDERTARQLGELVTGVVDGDIERVISAAGAIADVSSEKLDDRALRADVNQIISQFKGTPFERLNLGQVLQDFFATLRNHNVRCPADIILLIKALTTIESVGRDLDPSFELVPFVQPYLEELVKKRYGTTAIYTRLKRGLLQYLELVEDIPSEIRPIISQLRKNKLAVNLEHRGLDRLTHTIEHASRNIASALIIAALFIGSSIVILSSHTQGLTTLTILGIAGLAAAAFLTILMMLRNRKERGG